MIIKIIKHLDLLPQPEATEVTTMETPSVIQLPTTQPSNETGDSNHSSYTAEKHPPSDTFTTSLTSQAPSSSTADITDINNHSSKSDCYNISVNVIDVQHDTVK